MIQLEQKARLVIVAVAIVVLGGFWGGALSARGQIEEMPANGDDAAEAAPRHAEISQEGEGAPPIHDHSARAKGGSPEASTALRDHGAMEHGAMDQGAMDQGAHVGMGGMGPADHSSTRNEHSMGGIPRWMYLSGGLFILLATMGVAGMRRGRTWGVVSADRRPFNLLSVKPLETLVRKPWFPLFIQAPMLLFFGLVVAAGLLGSTYTNIAPVLTWTVWWALLVFIVLILGKAFCAVCPWDALAGMVQRGSLFRNRTASRTMNRPWPRWARNIYPATLLFIGLTWLELGFGVTRDAQATAVLGLLMLCLTVGAAVVFERRAFCRYGCLIGRISGLYAMFAPVELRPESAEICKGCRTRDCVRGSDFATACPTFENPSRLSRNTYCTLCTECVRACPHGNISLRVRPFGADLNQETEYRKDEAHLAIVLLALTSFHGLTMTPTWYECTDLVQAALGVGYRVAFSILMAACIVIPILLFRGLRGQGTVSRGVESASTACFGPLRSLSCPSRCSTTWPTIRCTFFGRRRCCCPVSRTRSDGGGTSLALRA